MSSTTPNRRQFLATSASGALAGLALAGCAKPPKVAETGSATAGAVAPEIAPNANGGMPLARFQEYIGKFNANDPSFTEFYHDDVVLELGAREIRGPQGIRDFYKDVKAHIHEKVDVTHFVSDATGIAAELPTEFRVYKDWDNGFFGRPLKAGEVMRVISFVMYWVKDGKFELIKSARYKQVNDWQMESEAAVVSEST
jgi:hypothetical protein